MALHDVWLQYIKNNEIMYVHNNTYRYHLFRIFNQQLESRHRHLQKVDMIILQVPICHL